MSVELVEQIETAQIQTYAEEMYNVCLELSVVSLMWAEISVGPRNANDAYVLDNLNTRLRALRQERATLHRAIHELPIKRR